MTGPFLAKKVAENVYWVGAIDWQLPDFHGYRTERGTTYNAFLIVGEKVTLIDTVKKPYFEEMLSRIASVVDPAKIDYIISNHAEPDHTGALEDILKIAKNAKVFASQVGAQALKELYQGKVLAEPVKNGERLDLGGFYLTCLETRMIHWPDSMFSYLEEREILFSQDAFGMHLATALLFADENAPDILRHESDKYYANIVLPYSKMVGMTLKKFYDLKLPLSLIAPDHGPLWRGKDIEKILSWYDAYVKQPYTKKVVIVYDTMWGSSGKLASAFAEGVAKGGCVPKVISLKGAFRSDVMKELIDAGALAVGSCTINNGLFPTLADILTYIRGLHPINLLGAIFGSYGWNLLCFEEIKSYLEKTGIPIVTTDVRAKFTPDEEKLSEACAQGEALAAALLQKIAEQ